MSRAGALTKYAWRFRYPGAPYEPALDEGRTAFNLAREVMDAILGRLPFEVRPQRPRIRSASDRPVCRTRYGNKGPGPVTLPVHAVAFVECKGNFRNGRVAAVNDDNIRSCLSGSARAA